MKGLVLSVFIVLLFLNSCNDNAIAYTDGELQLENVVETTINEDFLTLGYNLTKVPLTLPDSVFLTGSSHVIYVSHKDSSVFVSDGKLIYRFDKEDILKNTIGNVGHGDMEYQNIFSTSLDTDEEKVYIYAGNNKMYVYTFEGTPADAVTLESDAYIGGAYRKKDGYWAEALKYDKEKAEISIVEFDNNGKQSNKHILASFEVKSHADYYPSPIVSQKEEFTYNYYCPYTAKLYSISDEGINCILTISGGKYSYNCNQLNNMEYRTNNRDRFVEILDIYSDNKTIYLLYTTNRKLFASIIYETSGRCVYNSPIDNPKRGGGMQISKGIETKTWPQYVCNNALYSICFDDSSKVTDADQVEEPNIIILKDK